MIQVVVLQSVIWYTLLLFLFEFRAARNALMVIKLSDQSTSTKAERSSTEDRDHSIVHDMMSSSEDELVHVIVAAKPLSPPAEPEQLRVQNSNKVAPESSEKEKREEEYGKELHMFVWRCACCDNPQGLCEHSVQVCSRRDEESGDADKAEECTDQKKEEQMERDTLMYSSMSLEMLRLIMSMVWSKLIRNPNTYASIFGLIWAFVSAKWAIKKPVMMENSVM
ncbi:hypothetical protein J5N97_001173 [Dioscorea zingiberensis]|uniref:Uncharacterized protein n=1 Tax=Dioscorea zingiberensis TaxID=325984 RepID=A0A9D5BUH2_9LILI|nr:hypothetical protein J5N97_001173 [Dioscorea zingiberensis]